MIVLSRNECPYPPSPKVLEYLGKYVKFVNRYEVPELTKELMMELSNYTSLPEGFIEVLPGSEALFIYMSEALRSLGLTLVYSSPTFIPAIEDLKMRGVQLKDVPLDEDYRLNIEEISKAGSRESILYIVNPNNPTGGKVLDCDVLPKLLRMYRAVILDESYYEFSDLTCADLLEEHDNLLILRTLSKAFCLAGARVGYVLGAAKLRNALLRTRRLYDVSLLSMAAAIGALKDLNYMRETVSKIKETKNWFIAEVRRIDGTEVINTLTNFVLINKKNYDSRTLANYFRRHGIDVKDLTGRLNKFVRVSIGTPGEMRTVVNLLKLVEVE